MRISIIILCFPFLSFGKDSLNVNQEILRIGGSLSLGYCFPHITRGAGVSYGENMSFKDHGEKFYIKGLNILLFPLKKNRIEVQFYKLTFKYRTVFQYHPANNHNNINNNKTIPISEKIVNTLYALPVLYNRKFIDRGKMELSGFGGISFNWPVESFEFSTVYYKATGLTLTNGFKVNERVSNSVLAGLRFDYKIGKNTRLHSNFFYNHFIRSSGRRRSFEMPGVSAGLNYAL